MYMYMYLTIHLIHVHPNLYANATIRMSLIKIDLTAMHACYYNAQCEMLLWAADY